MAKGVSGGRVDTVSYGLAGGRGGGGFTLMIRSLF